MEFRFTDIRENYDLTKTDVAKRIGTGKRNYTYIESETANIKLALLNDYCNQFGYSMDYVAKLTDKFSYSDIIKIKEIDKGVMAERLRIIEKENKLEANDIARELGIAPSTYSDYKNVKKTNLMQSLMLKQIASKYSYSMDWIVGRSEQKHIKK